MHRDKITFQKTIEDMTFRRKPTSTLSTYNDLLATPRLSILNQLQEKIKMLYK